MGDESSEQQPEQQNGLPERLRDHCWKPGQSGNPGGRPKRKWLTEVTEELLQEKLQDPVFRESYKESLWQKLLSNKVVSSMTLEKVWERTEGKMTQPVDVTGELTVRTLSERMSKAKERLDGK